MIVQSGLSEQENLSCDFVKYAKSLYGNFVYRVDLVYLNRLNNSL